jgi:hypothetical protein
MHRPISLYLENLTEHLAEIGVHGKIILKRILQKQEFEVLSGLNCIAIGFNVMLL